MKKKLLFLLVLFMPFFINAKEKCNIISGNGKDIGSEIVCGTEHFYIIENKEDSVRMLAKYNLDFGEVYNKVTVSAERYNEIKNLCNGANYCNGMFGNFHEFYGYTNRLLSYQNDDGTYTYFVSYGIDKDEIKQNPKAIGAHGDEKGNPDFPEYGVVDYYSGIIDDDAENLYGTPYGNKAFIDYNVHSSSLNNSNSINHIINEYKTYMNDNGFDIINYDLLSVNELNNLTYKITKSYLPLEEWADNEWEEVENIKVSYWIVGSIKEYLPDEFDWIYGTTYWTRTAIPYYNSDGELNIYGSDLDVYFVDTLGNLCNASGCSSALGAGIRPVIEISKDDIDYNPLLKCNIVSGDGQNIGSEIECAGEHFYVIDNKKDSLKVLAKYNLDIGGVVNKITVSAERYNEIKELCSGALYCDAMFEEKEFDGYTNCLSSYQNDDGTYTYVVYYTINNSFIKQSSKAIGAHGDERGNPVFPEYGIIDNIAVILDTIDGSAYNEEYIDYMVDDAVFHFNEYDVEYIYNDYVDYLNNQGIMIENLDILSVKEIDDIVYKISGNRLPLSNWSNPDDWKEISGTIRDDWEYYVLGSVKEYLPEGFDWLYSTTYWTKTAYVDGFNDFYFMDSLGNLCNMSGCDITLGAGIRPVAEISKASINYNLIAESEEGGSLEKVNEVKAGDTIVLKPMAKAGYKLKGFTITTDSGKTIEVKEKDIIKNDDGTITINPDVFVMPLENVIITARWGFTNPKTGVFDYISFIMVGMLICTIGYISINQYNRRFEL